MKNILAVIALSLLISSCDKVHYEFLWTDRHPVPEGVYTPPPIQQLQRNAAYFVKGSTGQHIEEGNIIKMRSQYLSLIHISEPTRPY